MIIDTLLESVDWMDISSEKINQIKHEVVNWYDDYSELQEYRKLLGEDIGESFESKFAKWIVDRIQMCL